MLKWGDKFPKYEWQFKPLTKQRVLQTKIQYYEHGIRDLLRHTNKHSTLYVEQSIRYLKQKLLYWRNKYFNYLARRNKD